jgi:hypothetical protein
MIHIWIGILDTGHSILDTGYWMLDTGANTGTTFLSKE